MTASEAEFERTKQTNGRVLMKRFLRKIPLTQHLRRSQRGQSIVLLAFAFIALIAFVGLVTDISLLFVRYSALRRAVDASAIAAAGQIREGTDYGEVAIAAQQYIALHGLEADSILVETCETDIYQWRAGLGPWEGDPHPEALFSPVSANMPETELCDWDDPKKFVRVSAQIVSPTTFLSLIGIGSITLEATSVSETAVLDVALVIDISESMAIDTTTDDYSLAGLNPPGGGGLTMRNECYTPTHFDGEGNLIYDSEKHAGCCNYPGQGYVGDGRMQANGVYLPNGQIWHDANGNSMYDGPSEDGVASNVADPTDASTLVCNPFKDVKDAARSFIKRLDFVRGDRVVLVTFDRAANVIAPSSGGTTLRPLLRSEEVAITALNRDVGVMVNPTGKFDYCASVNDARDAYYEDPIGYKEGATRPYSYEAWAPCGNTNIGGGILAANDALTDPLDVRREAVWVMIVLSDGAANVTDPVGGMSIPDYGSYGYCPWWTFCCRGANCAVSDFQYNECLAVPMNPAQTPIVTEDVLDVLPLCNDNDPMTRHFCLDWGTGEPDLTNPECGVTGKYDADDYARDMADFAGLIEVAPNQPGNFIAMYSIAFGEDVVNEATGAPLLRYIADAGDNGFIDDNIEQDLRDNGVIDIIDGNYPNTPPWGEPGECEDVRSQPKEKCGNYYYAEDLATLSEVFEDIAGRLFTRLSR